MIKVLFICHGNICPFPYVEFILRDMVAKRGIADQFEIASAATSREEIGNPVYPPAVRKLREHGIDPSGKRARQMTKQDYEYYDYLLAAEQYNIQNMLRIVGGDPEHKIHRLLDYAKHPRDIDDPWYSGISKPRTGTSWRAAKHSWRASNEKMTAKQRKVSQMRFCEWRV